jgi:hypothetical protein
MIQHFPNTPQTPLLGSGILRWFRIVPSSARHLTFHSLTTWRIGSVRFGLRAWITAIARAEKTLD